MKLLRLLPLCLLTACIAAPQGGTTSAALGTTSTGVTPQVQPGRTQAWRYEPDLAVSAPPYTTMSVNWKQRVDQPYVYVEYTGSYTETGRLLPGLHRALQEQGIEPAGPPFGLYYDDPGTKPTAELRSRACVPVGGAVQPSGSLSYDVLASKTVVYGIAGGAYPEVPRCYPRLFEYMRKMGWAEDGPIRESYLVSPGSVSDYGQLMTEVQIPIRYSR